MLSHSILAKRTIQKEPGMVHIAIIPAARRLREEDHKFYSSLGYIVILCLKNKRRNYYSGRKRGPITIFHCLCKNK
jgi:hypothetical protein